MIARLLLVGFLYSSSLAQTPSNTPAEIQQGYRPLRAALHVHSRFSDGDYDVSELVSLAHEHAINVLGLTDSLLTVARYGIPPFRKLLSRARSRQGILDAGIENYLEASAEAQNRFKDVLVLPGLEVTPYYYWQGMPGSNLRLYDFDRHMVIFGLSDARVIANLPVIENETWSNTRHDWTAATGPLVTLAIGVLVLVAGRGSLRFVGALIVLAGLAWTYDAYPFGRLSDPYSGKNDWQAFQRVIDYGSSHRGLTYWSYPEARYPEVQTSGATMVSRAQPESLARTRNYTGFEGIYGDNRTITNPGNLWDELLLDYIHNGRQVWPSAITGIDFHSVGGKGGWHDLDRGLTILWAKSGDIDSVMDALRRGRVYASYQQDSKRTLGLENFALHSEMGTAVAGETISTDGEVTLTARVYWNSEGPPEQPGEIDVIRDGELLDHREIRLPAEIVRSDTLENGKHYYRLRITTAGTEILSNPVFCEVGKR